MTTNRRSSRKPFRFKQFSVSDDRCGMKVGTDAVLLGAWANPKDCQSILDIGTGCGIITLMLAQRSQPAAIIDGVEIAQYDCEQAKENVSQSPWPEKINIHHSSIQDFDPGRKFDLIVSNPPYFVNSLLPPSGHRRRTRHTSELTFEYLCRAARRLMNSNGTFSVILPVVEGDQFLAVANQEGLFLSRRLAIYSLADKPQERWLMDLRFQSVPELESETMVLLNAEGGRTADYQRLCIEFYI